MNQERGYWDVVTNIAAVAAFIISILALIEASRDDAPRTIATGAVARAAESEPARPEAPTPEPPSRTDTSAVPSITTSTAPSSDEQSEIRSELSEFEITLSSSATAGRVIVEVVNEGAIVHNLVLVDGDRRTPDLQAGESARLDLGRLEPGEYVLVCDIPGHRQAGMETTLTVGSLRAASCRRPASRRSRRRAFGGENEDSVAAIVPDHAGRRCTRGARGRRSDPQMFRAPGNRCARRARERLSAESQVIDDEAMELAIAEIRAARAEHRRAQGA